MEKTKTRQREVKLDKVEVTCDAIGRTCSTITTWSSVAIVAATAIGYTAYKIADYRFNKRRRK